MTTKASGYIVTASATGQTQYVSLGPGRWALDLTLSGSTVELQARSRTDPNAVFKTILLPDDSSSTSSNDVIEVAGGVDYCLDVTTYVGAVKFSVCAIA